MRGENSHERMKKKEEKNRDRKEKNQCLTLSLSSNSVSNRTLSFLRSRNCEEGNSWNGINVLIVSTNPLSCTSFFLPDAIRQQQHQQQQQQQSNYKSNNTNTALTSFSSSCSIYDRNKSNR